MYSQQAANRRLGSISISPDKWQKENKIFQRNTALIHVLRDLARTGNSQQRDVKKVVSGLSHQKWKAAIKGFGFFFLLFILLFFFLPLKLALGQKTKLFHKPHCVALSSKYSGGNKGRRLSECIQEKPGIQPRVVIWTVPRGQESREEEGSFVEILFLPVLPPSLISKHWWLCYF